MADRSKENSVDYGIDPVLKKKLKALAVEKDSTMTELIIMALKEVYKELV
jgi:hypothetical protein